VGYTFGVYEWLGFYSGVGKIDTSGAVSIVKGGNVRVTKELVTVNTD